MSVFTAKKLKKEERILFNRHASVFKTYDKLSGKNKEDVYLVLKEYVSRNV